MSVSHSQARVRRFGPESERDVIPKPSPWVRRALARSGQHSRRHMGVRAVPAQRPVATTSGANGK